VATTVGLNAPHHPHTSLGGLGDVGVIAVRFSLLRFGRVHSDDLCARAFTPSHVLPTRISNMGYEQTAKANPIKGMMERRVRVA
jgi:hypothetical protein